MCKNVITMYNTSHSEQVLLPDFVARFAVSTVGSQGCLPQL